MPRQHLALSQRARRAQVERLTGDVDGERSGVGEQQLPLVWPEPDERRPQLVRAFGQPLGPEAVPRVDRLRRRRVRQPRGLRAEARRLRAELQAGVGAKVVKDGKAERVQDGEVRRIGIAPDRVAQRHGFGGGELGHQPFGQRLRRTVVLRLVGLGLAADGDHRRRARGRFAGRVPVAAGRHRRNRGLVVRPNEPALDPQPALMVERDERAAARDLGRVVDEGAVVERRDLDLERLGPGDRLVGHILITLVGGIEAFELVGAGLVRGLLLVAGLGRLPVHPAQARCVPVGEVERRLDPLPALRADRLGLRRELLGDEPVEQRHVVEPAALVLLEQVARDVAACGLVGIDAHEHRAPVACRDRALG